MGNRGFGWMVAILLTLPFGAGAQTMVPSQNGVCPSGSTNAGSGYCRSTSGRVIAHQGGERGLRAGSGYESRYG